MKAIRGYMTAIIKRKVDHEKDVCDRRGIVWKMSSKILQGRVTVNGNAVVTIVTIHVVDLTIHASWHGHPGIKGKMPSWWGDGIDRADIFSRRDILENPSTLKCQYHEMPVCRRKEELQRADCNTFQYTCTTADVGRFRSSLADHRHLCGHTGMTD